MQLKVSHGYIELELERSTLRTLLLLDSLLKPGIRTSPSSSGAEPYSRKPFHVLTMPKE